MQHCHHFINQLTATDNFRNRHIQGFRINYDDRFGGGGSGGGFGGGGSGGGFGGGGSGGGGGGGSGDGSTSTAPSCKSTYEYGGCSTTYSSNVFPSRPYKKMKLNNNKALCLKYKPAYDYDYDYECVKERQNVMSLLSDNNLSNPTATRHVESIPINTNNELTQSKSESNKLSIANQLDLTDNTTIKYLKSTIPKLNNGILYDEDGYEMSNMNTKIDDVADIDDNTFVLNAKIDQPKQYENAQSEKMKLNSGNYKIKNCQNKQINKKQINKKQIKVNIELNHKIKKTKKNKSEILKIFQETYQYDEETIKMLGDKCDANIKSVKISTKTKKKFNINDKIINVDLNLIQSHKHYKLYLNGSTPTDLKRSYFSYLGLTQTGKKKKKSNKNKYFDEEKENGITIYSCHRPECVLKKNIKLQFTTKTECRNHTRNHHPKDEK